MHISTFEITASPLRRARQKRKHGIRGERFAADVFMPISIHSTMVEHSSLALSLAIVKGGQPVPTRCAIPARGGQRLPTLVSLEL